MNAQSFGVLSSTLDNLIQSFSGNWSSLSGLSEGVLSKLIAIELILFFLWSGFSGGQRMVAEGLRKFFVLGVWIWVVRQFPMLAKAVLGFFIRAGTTAAGSGSESFIYNPSKLVARGFDVAEPLAAALADLGITDIGMVVIYAVGYWAIMLAFGILAIQVFLTIIEFYLVVTAAIVLIPFGVNSYLKFLAEKAIGAVFAFGVKVMVLTIIISIAQPTLDRLTFVMADEITTDLIWANSITALAFAFLAWQGPSIAMGLMSGAPSLAASAIMQNASGAAGAMVGGASNLSSVMSGMRSMAMGAAGAATSMVSKVSNIMSKGGGGAQSQSSSGSPQQNGGNNASDRGLAKSLSPTSKGSKGKS